MLTALHDCVWLPLLLLLRFADRYTYIHKAKKGREKEWRGNTKADWFSLVDWLPGNKNQPAWGILLLFLLQLYLNRRRYTTTCTRTKCTGHAYTEGCTDFEGYFKRIRWDGLAVRDIKTHPLSLMSIIVQHSWIYIAIYGNMIIYFSTFFVCRPCM